MAIIAVDLTTVPVLAAIACLAVLAIAAVWLIPKRQARRWAGQGIHGKELADLENSARGTLVQIVGGFALILTFAATWTQIADTRKATNRTLRLNAAQQETDRFTRAVGQLGSAQFALRLGGIYGLERLARDSADERGAVINLLTAYLREKHPARHPRHAPRVLSVSRYTSDAFLACRAVTHKPAADTQAALTAILRTAARLPGHTSPLDLSGLDLRAVDIRRSDLRNADLSGSSLEFALAEGANFDDVDLEQADMRDACLAEATFKRTLTFGAGWWTWGGANVEGADLYDTRSAYSLVSASETSVGYDEVSRPQLRGTEGDECTRYPWRPKVPHYCGTSSYVRP